MTITNIFQKTLDILNAEGENYKILRILSTKKNDRICFVVENDGNRYFVKRFLSLGSNEFIKEIRLYEKLKATGYVPEIFKVQTTTQTILLEYVEGDILDNCVSNFDQDYICGILGKAFASISNIDYYETKSYKNQLDIYIDILQSHYNSRDIMTSAIYKYASKSDRLKRFSVHRDFHTGNILLDKMGRIKVTDFESYGYDAIEMTIAKICFGFCFEDRSITSIENRIQSFIEGMNLKEFVFDIDNFIIGLSHWCLTCKGFYLTLAGRNERLDQYLTIDPVLEVERYILFKKGCEIPGGLLYEHNERM
jgi:serine/threonine protein kinase